jgi:enoyl-[acyl-carrier protein] reductase I
MQACAGDLRSRWGRVDGVVHAIGFAPEDALGGNFLNTPWESVATAFKVSAYSLKDLAVGMAPLMADGGGIVALDFDARQAWAAYDWMGVAKAGLESVTRYLARDLGPKKIRVNCVAAGPVGTVAAKSIPGFSGFEDAWQRRAPLGWDAADPRPVANMACFLMSDYATMTTGEMVHVDGGYHAMGTEIRFREQ